MDAHLSLLRELAHELRGALSPARSALDLMRLRHFEAETSRVAVQRIERGLEAALATLDAFVLAQQCADGTVALQPVSMPLAQLLQLTRASLAPTTLARCTFTTAEPAPYVLADSRHCVLALSALLEHAAAVAAPQAGIEVRTSLAQPQARVHVRFATDAAHAAVATEWFESYRSLGASRMALRTARCILQLQQGDLQLECGAGECQFLAVFEIASRPQTMPESPSPAAEATCSPVTPAGARRLARVIIVDDSAEVRRAYREGLALLGYTVSEAGDADSALRAISESMPDIALIDIRLPGMNGYQLARALRQSAAKLRLVMLSGITLDEVTQRESRSAGFDRCFDKAGGPRALHALLAQLE
jgi:CheY-like chemotaxis protein